MAAATGSELQKMTLPVGLGEAGLGRGFLFYRLGVTVSGHPLGGAPLSWGLLSIGDSPHHHQALGESGMPRAGAGGRGSLWTGASLKGRSKLASAAPWAPRTPCPRGAHPGPPLAPYHLASGTAPTQQPRSAGYASREPAWPLLPLGSSPGPALSPKVLTHTMPPARWFIRSGSWEVLRPEHVPVDPSPADAVFPVAGAVVRVPRSGPGARGLGGPRCARQGTTGLGAPVLASPGDPVALPRAFPSPHGP